MEDWEKILLKDKQAGTPARKVPGENFTENAATNADE
jgi:hypothetical protein